MCRERQRIANGEWRVGQQRIAGRQRLAISEWRVERQQEASRKWRIVSRQSPVANCQSPVAAASPVAPFFQSPIASRQSLRRGQAVLLATLIMFVVAAVGAGFILFVQSSMNLSQRAREEQEALLLAQAGLAFADAQLTENGADWRPSIMVDFDEFEKAQGWHRPDSDNDWYGKYAARQVVDLIGNVAGSGAFLVKVKYKPGEQVLKIISIGRPRPNSPVYRRLVAYKPILTDWIWVTAENETNPDPLLFDADNDNLREVLLGQAINWQVEQNFWFNAERDPLPPITVPTTDPVRLSWLRLRTWLSPNRLPIWDRTVVFTSTIRINSDLLWYGTNALEATSFFAASQTVLEVARTISHYADTPVPVGGTQVLVYADDPITQGDIFQGLAVPSASGSGFQFFPVDGIPRYMDGWERIGGLMPVRWVFNFPRRVEPRRAPTIDLNDYYAQTRDADPAQGSRFGYYRVPLTPPHPISNAPNADGFYESDCTNQPFLAFRGIYIDNGTDKQFGGNSPADAPASAFNDNSGTYRPELAQVYDWVVKPPQTDPANPNLPHPRRQQQDSGWLQDDDDVNASTERNVVELRALDASNTPRSLNFATRMASPHLYVPPGVEVRFDVVPTSNPQTVLQRTWLIRHDGQPFRDPGGNDLRDLPDPNNPTVPREDERLVFIDPVQLTSFDADNDGQAGEDHINFRDDDNDGRVDEDPLATAPQFFDQPQDNDGDGRVGEDPINGRDDDGDGRVDEDPPVKHPEPRIPTIVIVADGNIRVSGQVAVAVKIVTPETIYIEGPLHPVTANATIELLAKRNICLNFAAARTPIPSLDGLDPTSDRALLLPQFRIVQINPDPNRILGMHYLLPNTIPSPDPRLPLFADLLGGSVGTLQFPKPEPDDRNLVNNTASVTYALMAPSSLPLSDDLQNNFTQLQNRTWTLRLILLHRGLSAVRDSSNPNNWLQARNPWTNLEVDLWFDENGNRIWDTNEPRTRLYGPAEPMRTFPVASRWYQGDGRPVDPNDPTTGKEWGILDIPIPPNVLDLNGDGQLTPNELRSALQKMRITVTSPVAGEVIPQGRTPVSYELAGIKLALYDEQGLPRPIWQPVIPPIPTQQNPFPLGSPFFVLAQTILAENGTIGIVPPPYFDPTAHPSWQQLIANPNWWTHFRQWQRLWSFYYLRHNSVRWSPFLDPATLPSNLQAQLLAQSIPILAGRLIMRVTPQTMLWRLAAQGAFDAPTSASANALRFAWELSLDKAALPYGNDLNPQNKLADLTDLQRQIAPVFAEVPHTMFSSAWLWAWRAAPLSGVLDVRQSDNLFARPPNQQYFRAPVVPNLKLPKGYVMVLQQQVGKD